VLLPAWPSVGATPLTSPAAAAAAAAGALRPAVPPGAQAPDPSQVSDVALRAITKCISAIQQRLQQLQEDAAGWEQQQAPTRFGARAAALRSPCCCPALAL
jgi:hypothetical protein